MAFDFDYDDQFLLSPFNLILNLFEKAENNLPLLINFNQNLNLNEIIKFTVRLHSNIRQNVYLIVQFIAKFYFNYFDNSLSFIIDEILKEHYRYSYLINISCDTLSDILFSYLNNINNINNIKNNNIIDKIILQSEIIEGRSNDIMKWLIYLLHSDNSKIIQRTIITLSIFILCFPDIAVQNASKFIPDYCQSIMFMRDRKEREDTYKRLCFLASKLEINENFIWIFKAIAYYKSIDINSELYLIFKNLLVSVKEYLVKLNVWNQFLVQLEDDFYQPLSQRFHI